MRYSISDKISRSLLEISGCHLVKLLARERQKREREREREADLFLAENANAAIQPVNSSRYCV